MAVTIEEDRAQKGLEKANSGPVMLWTGCGEQSRAAIV